MLIKGLDVGIFSAALEKGQLSADGYAAMIASTTQINRVGADLPAMEAVHSCTNVNVFGLLSHALEMEQGAGLRMTLRLANIPLLDGVAALAEAGFGTGASGRNWDSYAGEVTLPAGMPNWQRRLLWDPQNSGGLLIAVALEGATVLMAHVRPAGFGQAASVGGGEVRVEVF